jgi:O-succinylbenzoate synthase
MRIERVDLIHVQVPLVEPFRISTASVAVKDALLCLLTCDGITGLGESSPMAGDFYSADTPESCLDALRSRLVPMLLATDIDTPSSFAGLADEWMPGANFAKAGLEMALWDLDARRRNVPLYELLGGSGKPVPSGLAVGICDSIGELLRRIEAFLAEGYVRVKIKIRPGWDVEPISAIRREFGDIPLMVDANAVYRLCDEHVRVFKVLDDFGLIMFEQPFAGDALEDLATLQAMVATPVCIDESADSIDSVARALSLGAARIVNIKLQRVGGFGPAIAIHDLCRDNGIPVWCGYMPELGVSTFGGVHMATLPGFTLAGDLEPSLRWFTDDITRPLVQMGSPGAIDVPHGPGLGIDLDMEKVARYSVSRHTFVR